VNPKAWHYVSVAVLPVMQLELRLENVSIQFFQLVAISELSYRQCNEWISVLQQETAYGAYNRFA